MRRFLLLCCLLPAALCAGVTGKIAGTITDASTREPVVGANVVITGTLLGGAADAAGAYTILNVPPGVYTVRISAVGYETISMQRVTVAVDQTTPLSYGLRNATVQMTEVVVSATTPAIHKDITSSISVVSQEQIEQLPVASFTDVLALQAGVVGSGSDMHVRGGRSNEVAYLIDGTYVQDPLLGGLAATVGNDAIQEMSFLSGTFNAEYGNALSGVVNIITREGSDEFKGKVEVHTSEFGVRRFTALHENRVTGNIGGPIIPGLLRFFATAEENNRGSYLPFGHDKQWNAFAKLTLIATPWMKWNISNRASGGDRQSYNHSYKYIPQMYSHSTTDNYQGVLNLTHTVASNFFYELKASYFNQGYFSGMDRDTSQYIPEGSREFFYTEENGVSYEDFYSLSTPVSFTRSRTASVDVRADAVWQWGQSNEIKFGGQFKKHWLRLFRIDGVKRPLPLQYIDHYYTDKPYEAAAYVQDKIEFPFLIINVGLRFDYLNANVQFRNEPLDPQSVITVQSRTQISPRIGIAHPISDRTKLHFSYGHFFQNPDYQFLFENKEYKVTVREPLFGQPALDAQRTVAYEIGIAHQLSDRVLLNVTAYYKDVTGLLGTRYYPAYLEGRYTAYTLYINEDYANIKGFEISLDIRPDKYFSGGLTYTYSVAKGNASSEGENYGTTYKATLLSPLDFDKTHVVNASGTLRMPAGTAPTIAGADVFGNMDLTIIARASSGYPYTPSGRNIGFVGKNSLRLPGAYGIDLEFGKEIELARSTSLRVFVEALNITDRRNVLYVYADTGDPDFTLAQNSSKEYMRDPSNYGPPMNVRIGAAIRF